jgi:2-keto-4-pentenoate hydratase/2-oxohepta-3-ene-1,7-dioic acid hydratase in catechol pathway
VQLRRNAEVISYLSTITLEPGDVILTGIHYLAGANWDTTRIQDMLYG